MSRTKWIKTITKQTKDVGTYRPAFDHTIEALADVLVQRDAAMKQYKDEGSHLIVTHTNKAGAENATKNPLFTTWQDLSALALTYWRDLGLTPAGLRRIDEGALKQPRQSALGEALASLSELNDE